MARGLYDRSYVKVSPGLWLDPKFRALSAPGPSGQSMYFYLLTSPRVQALPGLVVATEEEMAKDVGWRLQGLRRALCEVCRKGMASVDVANTLVMVPGGVRVACANTLLGKPYIVRDWYAQWSALPDCEIKVAYRDLLAKEVFAAQSRDVFIRAFVAAFEHGAPWVWRGGWSKDRYAEVFTRDGNACRYCGSAERLTIDHVVPRCQGGGDGAENLVVACKGCNSRKNGRTPQEAGVVLRPAPEVL